MAGTTRKNLSDLELELLRFLAASGPKSAREAAEEFGEPNGYARTTVMTLLERLRQKGYLNRTKVGGVYRHASKLSSGELMRNVVGRFVQRALGGSVSPLVAFLAENPKLTDAEIAELRRLVDEIGGSK
jgi:predicted transcriptional regulator